MAKALLLLSGGLDSMLAGKILLEMGVEVEAINFTSPFCRCTPKTFGCSAARAAADSLGIAVRTLVKGEEYLDVVKRPRFGRGSGMNPCLDCRVFTFRKAKDLLPETRADFVATGEVLGQRPMSQRRDAMRLIERESGLEGLIVRPLSAQLLPPSLPEQNGQIDRGRLLSVQGRSRREQMGLAEGYGIGDYPCPAGGCLLTDPEFAARMRELLAFEPDCDLNDVLLLSAGRHFRLPTAGKAVVGRNEADNRRLDGLARRKDWLLLPAGDLAGPVVLLRPGASVGPDGESEALRLAAGLLVRFSRNGRENAGMDVEAAQVLAGDARDRMVLFRSVPPLDPELAESWRLAAGKGKIPKPAAMAGAGEEGKDRHDRTAG